MDIQVITPEIQIKKPKDMTPEEYLNHKRILHNERMKRYLTNHPEKRYKATKEQIKKYNEKNKEYRKEFMRDYMREYMRNERAKLREIKESLAKQTELITVV
jgi:hypothetical protein